MNQPNPQLPDNAAPALAAATLMVAIAARALLSNWPAIVGAFTPHPMQVDPT